MCKNDIPSFWFVQKLFTGGHFVTIENKFEHNEEDKHTHYLRREFAYTNFEQKYSLPDNVDEQAISAKVEDGILTIDLPKIKREEGKTTRQIAIS